MAERGPTDKPLEAPSSPPTCPGDLLCSSLGGVTKQGDRPPKDLDEVERAISLLEGRHPEHERTRREMRAAAEARAASLQKELAANARRRGRRVLVLVAVTVAVGAVGIVSWKLLTRASHIRDALARAEAPMLASGLEELASNQVTGRLVLDLDTPGSKCLVAVASAGDVQVKTGASTWTGHGSVGWCTCAAGHATVESQGAAGATVGLAVMQIDAEAVGGPLARPWTSIHPSVWGDSGGECAEATLDAWIGDHQWPAPPLTGQEMDALAGGAALHAAGFHVVARVAHGTPFAVVDAAAGDCTLAVAKDGDLSLRMKGGARPIDGAARALVWCSTSADTVSVWADGPGEALVLAAPAKRLGGLLGAREAAGAAGWTTSTKATWLRPEDRAWDASCILTASTVSDVVTAPIPTEMAAPDDRVAALVTAANAGVTWSVGSSAVACDPFATDGATNESVCVPLPGSVLWRKGEGDVVVARGTAPVWLSALAQRPEPVVRPIMLQLLSLARKLTRESFEPVLFEGVTELSDGVRVLGRAGEDAVVVVGLAPSPPWVMPYSDATPWDLNDAPRVIALAPGASVTLKTPWRSDAALGKRRTVVFRHAATH